MTEPEWLGCTDPTLMLEFLRGKVSDRKLRLFAVGCCRRIWHLMVDERSRQAVLIAERFADDLATPAECMSFQEAARSAVDAIEPHPVRSANSSLARAAAANAACEVIRMPTAFNDALGEWAVSMGQVITPLPMTVTLQVSTHVAEALAHESAGEYQPERMLWSDDPQLQDLFWQQHKGNSALTCCIAGPLPFRLITLEPAWLTSTVKHLAQSIYHDRTFDRLPILADALIEAGCDNADILAHCRSEGPHVRGCWVVDLLTGRE